ncbi:MAG: PEP-CTERM sorting domain-containing protein [Tepidisphaeraceae bacterium]
MASASIRSVVRSLPMLSLALAGGAASFAQAAAYDTAVNALNPVTYFAYETANASADVDTSIATGTNAVSGYSLYGIRSTASSTASAGGQFGVGSTYNAANGYSGFNTTNNVAQYNSANTAFASSVSPDGTTGIANTAAFRTATSTSAMTVSTWARIDTLPTSTALPTLAAVVVGTTSNTSASTGFQLNFTSTGIRVGGRSVSTDAFQSLVVPYADAGYNAGDFANIVGVADYANDTLSLYVNGTLVGTGSATFANTSLTYGTGTSAGIFSTGGIFNALNAANTGNGTSAGGQLYTGYSDQTAVFNRALTAEEIAGLYSTAVPEPASLALIALGGTAMLRRRSR